MFRCDGCGRSFHEKEIEKVYVLLVQSELWEPEPESEEFTFCSRKCLEDFIYKRRA